MSDPDLHGHDPYPTARCVKHGKPTQAQYVYSSYGFSYTLSMFNRCVVMVLQVRCGGGCRCVVIVLQVVCDGVTGAL